MAHSFQKILIVQTAFIGDVILATALIEKLNAHYPKAQLDFLLRKGNESLLANHPKLHKVWIWDKTQHKQKNLFKLIQTVRAEKYDLLINLQRHFSTGLLTVFSKAETTIGFEKNPLSYFFSERVPHAFGDGTHEVTRNQRLIERITDPQPAMPRLYPSEAAYQKINEYLENPFICIAPASVWFTKQFPREQWAALCDALPETSNIYLLGAPSDKALCEWIKNHSTHPKIIILAGKISLLESAALMQHAQMNYVNDSAPMHLASAVNAPTCAIYCSTSPAFGFGPLAEVQHVIETQEMLACRPCGSHGKKACPKGHFNCALGIKTEALLAVLKT